MSARLLLCGCGKMGGALLEGWLALGLVPKNAVVVEPVADARADVSRRLNVRTLASIGDLPADAYDGNAAPDVVVFAVKPQVMDALMDQAAPACARFTDEGETVFLSIAAGRTIGYFEHHLGATAAIVRAMPNTPAAVGRGMTVATANANTGDAQRRLCDGLLGAVGEVAWVDDEGFLDAVTAVSGGGPAYVFLLAECLAQAAMDAGLPEDLARQLGRATVAGSGELLHQSAEAPEILRRNVTSPGGTTAEALKILMGSDGWQPLISRAIAAAAARSRELAG